MARLTAKIKRPDKEDLIVYTKGTYEDTIPAEMTKNDIRAILKKLAAYEDAEEQGRMIIFPCNKGDKMYEFYRECVEDRLEAGETPEDIVNVRKVYGFEYEDDVLYIRASYRSNHSELWGGHGEDMQTFPVSEIGKTVFLTYEEAEAKLKEMESADEYYV